MTFRPLARTLADSLAAMQPPARTARNRTQATLDAAADVRAFRNALEVESVRALIRP